MYADHCMKEPNIRPTKSASYQEKVVWLVEVFLSLFTFCKQTYCVQKYNFLFCTILYTKKSQIFEHLKREFPGALLLDERKFDEIM